MDSTLLLLAAILLLGLILLGIKNFISKERRSSVDFAAQVYTEVDVELGIVDVALFGDRIIPIAD